MPTTASLTVLVLLAAGAAAADPSPPLGGVEIRAGLARRDDRLSASGAQVNARGATVSHLSLGGSWFPGPHALGLAGRLEGERFRLHGTDPAGRPIDLAVGGLDASAAAAARLLALGGRLLLEGRLGYGFLQLPVTQVPEGTAPTTVTVGSLRTHGPLLAAAASFIASPRVTLETAARAMPVTFGGDLAGTSLSVRRLAGGASLLIHAWDTRQVRVAGLLSYELTATDAAQGPVALANRQHQFGVGLRASFPAPVAAAPVTVPVVSSRGTIRGLLRADRAAGGSGRPIAGARVTVTGGAIVHSDAGGGFVLVDLPPGLLTLEVRARGYQTLQDTVSVPEGELALELALRPAKAPPPAGIAGHIRSEAGTPVAARVRVLELGQQTVADVYGRFELALPAGRYTLTIEAAGFVGQRKTVEASPGEQNIYNIDLQTAP